jgi:hypothetical protein
MSPFFRQRAVVSWLGNAVLAMVIPNDAVTGFKLIDLYWSFQWLIAVSARFLHRQRPTRHDTGWALPM